MDSIEQQLQNDLRGLRWVHEFGWLRAPELGTLMWPKNATSAEAANRLIRSWVARKLVLVRELPDRAGKATVLALAGVRLLAEHGYEARTGKDIGTMSETGWTPPHSWRHDLIAAGVLANMAKRGYSVIAEQTLRRIPTKSPKLPDGLLCCPDGQWLWLEVEHSTKTGKNLQQLGKALALAATGEIHEVGGQRCSRAMVAYIDTRDTRGHNINHKSRVTKAISEQAKEPIEVLFAHCELRGASVAKVTITKERIEPGKVFAVLRVMNAHGWKEKDDEPGVMYSMYSQYIAYVWPAEEGLYGYQIEGFDGNYAASVSEAKKACATKILALLNPAT